MILRGTPPPENVIGAVKTDAIAERHPPVPHAPETMWWVRTVACATRWPGSSNKPVRETAGERPRRSGGMHVRTLHLRGHGRRNHSDSEFGSLHAQRELHLKDPKNKGFNIAQATQGKVDEKDL